MGEAPFDLVFIDADKESQVEYWELILPKLRSGGLMVVDNVFYGGDVPRQPTATRRLVVCWTRPGHCQWNSLVLGDPKRESSCLCSTSTAVFRQD